MMVINEHLTLDLRTTESLITCNTKGDRIRILFSFKTLTKNKCSSAYSSYLKVLLYYGEKLTLVDIKLYTLFPLLWVPLYRKNMEWCTFSIFVVLDIGLWNCIFVMFSQGQETNCENVCHFRPFSKFSPVMFRKLLLNYSL